MAIAEPGSGGCRHPRSLCQQSAPPQAHSEQHEEKRAVDDTGIDQKLKLHRCEDGANGKSDRSSQLVPADPGLLREASIHLPTDRALLAGQLQVLRVPAKLPRLQDGEMDSLLSGPPVRALQEQVGGGGLPQELYEA